MFYFKDSHPGCLQTPTKAKDCVSTHFHFAQPHLQTWTSTGSGFGFQKATLALNTLQWVAATAGRGSRVSPADSLPPACPCRRLHLREKGIQFQWRGPTLGLHPLTQLYVTQHGHGRNWKDEFSPFLRKIKSSKCEFGSSFLCWFDSKLILSTSAKESVYKVWEVCGGFLFWFGLVGCFLFCCVFLIIFTIIHDLRLPPLNIWILFSCWNGEWQSFLFFPFPMRKSLIKRLGTEAFWGHRTQKEVVGHCSYSCQDVLTSCRTPRATFLQLSSHGTAHRSCVKRWFLGQWRIF